MSARTLAATPRADPQDEAGGQGTAQDRSGAFALATLVLALVPLVAAFVRALGHWTSVGDNALITLRSLDVLTSNHPLLGTWTSASTSIGVDFNNPGPLQFDLLALPARLLPNDGPIIAVLLLDALSIVGIFLLARRLGGPVTAAAAMLVCAALSWSMGSDVLVEPWQPHSLLLPFLLFLFLVWSTSCGDHRSLPWLVAVGSLIVQTHVSYSILVPILCLWAVAGLVLTRRTQRTSTVPLDGAAGPGLRRTVIVALLVGALCWSQPVVEQLFGRGEGNMSRIVEAATAESAGPIGLSTATRLAGSVIGLPPWWVRPSFGQAWYVVAPDGELPAEGSDPPGLAPAATALAVVLVLIAGCVLVARRRGDRVVVRALLTAGVLIVLAVLTASRVPEGLFGTPPHQFRFLWPIAAFVTFAVVVTALRSPRAGSPAARALVPATAVLTAVVAVLAVPASNQGISHRPAAMEVIRDIEPQLSSLEGEGPLIIDELFGVFGDPYGASVLLGLQDRGIEFVTTHRSLPRQLGDGRAAERDEARGELTMATGNDARSTPEGARRVAFRDGLDEAEHRELAQLQDEVATYLSTRRDLPLTDDARPYLDQGAAPLLERQLESGTALDGELLVRTRSVVLLALRGMVDVPEPWRSTIERYAQLQHRADVETFALYLTPVT